MADTAKAIDALHAIPPDLPRDEWVKVGMAAHAAGLDFDTFDAWSAGAGNYDAAASRDTWRSFKPGKGIGPGTLYRVGAEHGWRMGEGKPQQRAAQAPKKAVEPQRKPAPGMSPAEVWERCEPATAAHGYIAAKAAAGVPLDGLRVVPTGDPLRIQGESMAGALVVPAYAPDGSLQSLQCVTTGDTAARLKAKGKKAKLNLPGAPMARASFAVGELVPGAPVALCEGVGTAWACWQATGHPAVACFGWGNVGKVAADLRQRDAAARLVLVPDTGKEESAAEIAQAVGAAVCLMPQGEETNFDANDLAQRDGFDVLAGLLEDAREPAPPGLPLSVAFADELPEAFTPPDELVEGVLTAGDGSVLYGDSNSGKTFFVIDMAAAVARGAQWMGRNTEPGLVVYLAAESPASVRGRLQAYQRHHGVRVPNFAIVQSPIDLFDGDADTEEDFYSGCVTGYRCAAELLEALARGYGPHIIKQHVIKEALQASGEPYSKPSRRGAGSVFMEIVGEALTFMARHSLHGQYMAAKIAEAERLQATMAELDAKEKAAFVERMKAAKAAKRNKAQRSDP